MPSVVRKTSAWEDLSATLSFLHIRDAETGAEVERWLLCSLPIPRAVLAEVQIDETWRSWLTDLVVASNNGKVVGSLRAADSCGLGVVDLDDESVTTTAERVLFPHSVLPVDLDDLHEFAVELGIKQCFDQLFREVHCRPDGIASEVVELAQYTGGEFEQLRFVVGRASSAGSKVSSSYVTCLCFEDGEPIVVRYWTGTELPKCRTVTGDLHWVRNDRIVSTAEVGLLAYSEGVRMAAYTPADRKVKADKDGR